MRNTPSRLFINAQLICVGCILGLQNRVVQSHKSWDLNRTEILLSEVHCGAAEAVRYED
jgi:hypothetical protein